jgi:uncharacterized cupredoxin-like copper-binding protein
MKSLVPIAFSAALLAAGVAHAHGDPAGKTKHAAEVVKEQKPWGIAGDAGRVGRTIRVSMRDSMRFEPAAIDVRQGETVRFVIRNDGKLMHEFVIGTKEENDRHAEQMVKFPNMEHDEPYMAHVEPGKTGEIVWTFNRPGRFHFACLIAGHYQAGMIGKLSVAAAPAAANARASRNQ